MASVGRLFHIASALRAPITYLFAAGTITHRRTTGDLGSSRELAITTEAPASLRAAMTSLLCNRQGFVGVMVAILLASFIGFAGLGVEIGLWYAIKRQNQSAADEAAISGAMEIVANVADITPQATYAATRNGFNNTAPNTITVNNPPTSGPNQVSTAVEVILSQQQGSLFASLYLPNVTIRTRAVATALSSPACLLALGTTGQDLQITGGSAIDMPGCSAITNSTSSQSVTVLGSATLTAQTVVTSGNISPNPCDACTLTTPATINAPATADPYATTVASITLPPASSCVPDPNVNATTPPSPSPPCYNNLTFGNMAHVTLAAGVYFINGNLSMSGTVSGTGVTFVIYGNGQINLQNGINATLSAPTTGGLPYQGLLFYQVGMQPASLAGCTVSNCTLTGAIYAPAAPVTYSGSSSSNCTVLIANSFIFTGSSLLSASQCSADGVATPSNLTGAVALAE